MIFRIMKEVGKRTLDTLSSLETLLTADPAFLARRLIKFRYSWLPFRHESNFCRAVSSLYLVPVDIICIPCAIAERLRRFCR